MGASLEAKDRLHLIFHKQEVLFDLHEAPTLNLVCQETLRPVRSVSSTEPFFVGLA